VVLCKQSQLIMNGKRRRRHTSLKLIFRMCRSISRQCVCTCCVFDHKEVYLNLIYIVIITQQAAAPSRYSSTLKIKTDVMMFFHDWRVTHTHGQMFAVSRKML
jgi:hypothetical protein